MSRSDKMLSVLADGEWHGRHEIQQRVGYFLTNNAASELRGKGFDVMHRRRGAEDFYRLQLSAESRNNPAAFSPSENRSDQRRTASREPAPRSERETLGVVSSDPASSAATARSSFAIPERLRIAIENERVCLAECEELVAEDVAAWETLPEAGVLDRRNSDESAEGRRTAPASESASQLDLFREAA